MSLSVSRLVRVTVNLSPSAAARRSFGILMVAGDSNVISGLERFRTYLNIEGVAVDFGVDSAEYLAAAKYFGQTPKPRTIMIGRWVRTATAALNIGGILSASEQLVSAWTAIASGGFQIVIDGVAKDLTGLDFTGVTNLNGVATVINTALTGGDVFWNGSNFYVESDTTGEGVKATGTVTLAVNPNNNDTLTLNGTVITFVSGTPTGSQVKIGASKEATAANLQLFLNATVVVGLLTASYTMAGGSAILSIQYNTVGTGGNGYTLAESTAGARIVISAATLLGGTAASSVGYATAASAGTDISALLKLTSATAQALVGGYDAETPVECAAVLANMSAQWYWLSFAASTQPTDDQSILVSDFIEALDLKRAYGVTITNTNVLSALVTTDLASRQKAGAYRQSLCQYSSSSPYAICSLIGRASTVDFTAENTTIDLMFKQEPGVVAEELTENQALVLQDKRCNVFVAYVNDTSILQYGVMSGPVFIDETHGLDWLQDAIQTACYNVLYTAKTKVPQTDAGVNKLVNAIDGVCGQAAFNGLVAPGVWNAEGFGELNTDDYLKSGYYIFAQSVALQSQSDREARIAPPIQVAVKLAGAIQTVDVAVDVNR